MEAQFRYFASPAAVRAAAPQDAPWAMANLNAKPRVRFPCITEIATRTRIIANP
jgi:hypothetical protein